MRPGRAKTVRPWSRACPTVIMEPDFSFRASATTRQSEKAAMSRFRSGKCQARERVPGGYSLMTPPLPSAMARNSSRCSFG